MLNNTIFKIIQQKYQNRSKIRKLKKLKFRTFKEVISLKAFKARYIKDFYNRKELSKLRKFFDMDKMTVDAALMKRSILNKIITRKYYALFFLKELPNRFLKRKRKYFKRKTKKKKLNLRVKFFYRITYDNFLFYLNLSNKQLIIKPLNFFNCLFFYKSKKFKKFYVVRKRRRMRFRFYYKFRRRKKRRSVRRRKIKYLKYKFKQKFLMRRFRQIKIRKYKNFLRFISFFNFCKKAKFKVDDYFKINSILNSPYNLLKLNFNKITNSYNFFLNFNSQRKIKIRFNNNKNILNKEKLKLYNLVKLKLQNRFILNNNLYSKYDTLLLDNSLKNNNLFVYKAPDYLFDNNLITNNISENYQINKLKINFQNLGKENKLSLFIKKITKISKKILFFEKKIINLKKKQKNKLSGLLFKLFKINKKIINKFLEYKQIIHVLLDIIIKLKNNLKKLILNFYFYYCNTLTFVKKETNLKFLKKIMFFLKRKKNRLKKKLKLHKQSRKFKSLIFNKNKFIFNKNKFIFIKNKKFRFSYKNKLNNGSPRYFKRLRKKKRRNKALKNNFLKSIKRTFLESSFFLYKNYFSKKNLRKNNNYSYFGNKKFKYFYLNFLKKTNLINLKNNQKIKNINFLNN
jgi:hypothetical protein